jgi:hypothetical protein
MEGLGEAVQGSAEVAEQRIVKARSFNLISGGPSRAHLTQADLIPDQPVVTVNRAIDVVEKGITVDFAMFADGPSSICQELGLGKYLIPPMQIWVPRPAIFPDHGVLNLLDLVSLWEPFLPMSVGIRTTPFGLVGGLDGKMRHQFGVLAALQRMLLFKPAKIRILCADMMGSWVPGKSEQECEEIQSMLEQHKRNLSSAQKRLNESRGRDKTAEIMRDSLQTEINKIQAQGDIGKFKRWEHERNALKVFVETAAKQGCEVEFKTPAKAVLV